MPHGIFDIPAKIIAEDRAKYYAKLDSESGDGLYGDIFKSELAYTLDDDSELTDWASNNMNWSDVEKFAVEFPTMPETFPKEMLERAWSNAGKKVIFQ